MAEYRCEIKENKMAEYRCEISDARVDNNSFCVALLDAPAFPTNSPLEKVIRQPLQAVIAATDASGKWGMIGLNTDEKNCIGDELNRLEVESGVWKYCNLYTK